MSEWKAKRFWKEARVEETEGAFRVALDGRPVRTPRKAPLALPTPEMAEAIAHEWDAQQDVIDPLSMPVTRSANAAIDKVASQHDEVAALLAAYAETDLLCHRAESPQGLRDQQNKGWDPLVDWAETRFGAPLTVVSGVLPAAQPGASLARLSQTVQGFEPFALTALHDLVTLSGSLVLGLAVAEGKIGPETGWDLSRIDESWQTALWGKDEEAEEMAAHKRAAFLHADRFLGLARGARGRS